MVERADPVQGGNVVDAFHQCGFQSSLDYAISRDAFGRATNVVDAVGREWRYEYGAFNEVLSEEVVLGESPPTAAAITRSFDSAGRPTGLALSVGGVSKGNVGYEYGDGGLLAQVVATNAQGRAFSVAYSNHAGRCIGYAVTTPDGDTIRSAVTRDFYRPGLVNGISTTFNDTVVDSLSYTYDALSRPTSRNSDVFAYNDRSEVMLTTTGAKSFRRRSAQTSSRTPTTLSATRRTMSPTPQPTPSPTTPSTRW